MNESEMFWVKKKWEKLHSLSSVEDQLKMLYQWTKTDNVTQKEFLYLYDCIWDDYYYSHIR